MRRPALVDEGRCEAVNAEAGASSLKRGLDRMVAYARAQCER